MHDVLRQSLMSLIEALPATDADDAARHRALRARLGQAEGDDAFVEVVQELTGFARALNTQALTQSDQWKDFIETLTGGIQTVEKSLSLTEQQVMAAYEAGRKAEIGFERQVQEVESWVRSGSSLGSVKQAVRQRLAMLRAQLDDKRAKSATRFSGMQGQLNQLAARVHELERETERLQQLLERERSRVLTDELTEVGSQAAWEQRLDHELARWRRYTTLFALVFLEVDQLDALAGQYGQPAADKALKQIAAILRTELRDADFIARPGQAAFAVLLTQTAAEVIDAVGTRLCARVAGAEFHYHEKPIRITLSAGTSSVREGDGAGEISARVLSALAQARQRGGNCCVCS